MSSPTDAIPTLSVRGLRKEFRTRGRGGPGVVIPVNDVSFDVDSGTTTALVGESGSGKSTLARLIMGLYRPDRGTITLHGTEIQSLRGATLRSLRAQFQMVFQNPLLSFDPTATIGRSIHEVYRLASGHEPEAAQTTVDELLTSVGLSPAFAKLKPRQVSGGELQRAAIARAIASSPRLLVLDEPTSALDVSIQGQVLALLDRLQRERGMSYLFATHDLKVVRLTSHRVIVLFRGRIVETADTATLFADARHPYTQNLLAAEHGRARPEADLAPAVLEDAPCPLDGATCPEPLHLVEVAPGHVVRCWRGYDGPGLRQ